jgi:hypothetical protein
VEKENELVGGDVEDLKSAVEASSEYSVDETSL